jgi:hypothetical protein
MKIRSGWLRKNPEYLDAVRPSPSWGIGTVGMISWIILSVSLILITRVRRDE